MIAVVDYGMGNLRSVQKGLEKVGVAAAITRDPAAILAADGVVLPGVGAFGACIANLHEFGLVDCVRAVIAADRPFLGICVGMQLLFEESEEFGPVRGLGILPGRVKRFAERDDLKVPHMGWNQLRLRGAPALLDGVADASYVYFVHSFFVEADDPATIAATTEYDVEFAAAVSRGNLFATQFHPEKSQRVGLRILENFGRQVQALARVSARGELRPGTSL